MSRAKCRNRSLFAHFDLRSILFDYAFGTEPWTIKKKKIQSYVAGHWSRERSESSLKLGREVGGRPTSTIDTRCRTCRPAVQHVCVQIVHLVPRVSASTCNSVVVTRATASLASCEMDTLVHEILPRKLERFEIVNAKQLGCTVDFMSWMNELLMIS